MLHVLNTVKRFGQDESGATAIEYGLIAALIATAVITAMTSLGSAIGTSFDQIGKTLTTKTKG